MAILTTIPTAMFSEIFCTDYLIILITLFLILLIYWILPDNAVVALLAVSSIPVILCIISLLFANARIRETGYKLLQKTPATKLTQVSAERDPDHAGDREYTYKFEDSNNTIYVVTSNDRIKLPGYAVKIPYDKNYGQYMHLFKGNKFIKDYEIEKTYYEK